tara:strand:+ start:345 stop:488 length:144 start_codon:yes stop_codon:yes gene_type:complete
MRDSRIYIEAVKMMNEGHPNSDIMEGLDIGPLLLQSIEIEATENGDY